MWSSLFVSLYINQPTCSRYLFVMFLWNRVVWAGQSQGVSLFRRDRRLLYQLLVKTRLAYFLKWQNINGMSFCKVVRPERLVANLESSSAAWFLIPVLCTISISNSFNQTLQYASSLLESEKFSNHPGPWYSVRNVGRESSEYVCSDRIVQATITHPRCVGCRCLSCSVMCTNTESVGAFSLHYGPFENRFILFSQKHSCLKCSVHSASAMKVSVVI